MKKTTKKFKSIFIALSMIVTLMSVMSIVHAKATVTGGNVASNNTEQAIAAFGEYVDVIYDSNTLTIDLQEDIVLEDPIVFTQGKADDRIVLNLYNHTIKGASGINGSDKNKVSGKNAIEYYPIVFDLIINGPGSIMGGDGAVYESSSGIRYGGDGGRAIYIAGSGPDINYNELVSGVTISKGALIKGGKGADLPQSIDFQYNAEAGNGGAAIGQQDAGVARSDAFVAFAKIVVENGNVEGGKGGSVDMSGFKPTIYETMTNPKSDELMEGCPINNFDRNVGDYMATQVGAGGNGIEIGKGRKYIEIDENGHVKGGDSGSADFGFYKTMNRFEVNTADAGDGIAVYGDFGLKNGEVDFTSWETKTKDSPDMGIYVAGSVSGGNAPDAHALNQNSGDGGSGIELHGDTLYGNDSNWGIIDIEGEVKGGDAGNAVSGNAGSGGSAIYEAYIRDDGTFGSPYGTNHYIVNGTVRGGNGGTSYSNAQTYANASYGTHIYVPALKGAGGYGRGGNAFNFGHYRENVNIVGNGHLKGGDAGSVVNRDGADVSDSEREAIYIYPKNKYDTFTVTADAENGSAATIQDKDQINVTATMSKFTDWPTSNTRLNCTIDTPTGYTGAVYIQWVGTVYNLDTDAYPKDIETSGTDYTSFKLLTVKDYKFLAYKTYGDDSEYNIYTYNYSTATADIFSEDDNKNSKKEICCYVLLEDGRWGKSNVMTFTKGWNTTTPITDPTEDDQAAADRVHSMIEDLPSLSNITLDDEERINEIREAYEALTDIQKDILKPYVSLLTDLEAAEDKIGELNQQVNDVVSKIENLPSTEAIAGINAENTEDVTEAKTAIEEAINAYNDLDDSQKRKVDGTTGTILNDILTTFNDKLPDSAITIAPVGPLPSVKYATITGIKNKTYTGKAIKQSIVVKIGGKTLKSGTDYTVSYKNNTKVGKATLTIKGIGKYTSTITKTFKINKAANPLNISAKTATVKYSKLKKKSQTLKVYKVIYTKKKGQGTVTYTKSSGDKKISINKKTGKVTVKKKRKKGKYKVKVKVKAAGNSNYKAITKTLTFTIKVK